MINMFTGCEKITSIDINRDNFDTSQVTDMSHAFQTCSSLEYLDTLMQ